jgi:hypothetical protein
MKPKVLRKALLSPGLINRSIAQIAISRPTKEDASSNHLSDSTRLGGRFRGLVSMMGIDLVTGSATTVKDY